MDRLQQKEGLAGPFCRGRCGVAKRLFAVLFVAIAKRAAQLVGK
jgi:hypothetical protein